MQELNVQSSNPTPYTPAGGTYNNNPIPGAGGLPALSGLNNRMNPMAQELQQQGRGQDSMLVHMTPDEVNDLQGLAMHYGTTMTINPNTGLPEAGLLGSVFKKLLPTLIGVGLAATGVGAPLAAGLVGIGSTALTGSLKKGLMAGLGAYGGASLAGAAGLGSSISKTGFGTLGKNAGIFGAKMGAGLGAGTGALGAAGATVGSNLPSYGTLVTGVPGSAAGTAAGAAAKTGIAGVAQKFGQTAAQGLPGIIGKAAPMVAASGLIGSISNATAPTGGVMTPTGQIDNSYQGPYYAQDRQQVMNLEGPATSKQRRHFAVGMPEIRNTAGQLVQPGGSTVRGTPVLQLVPNPKAKQGEPMYTQQYIPFMGGVDPEEEGYAKGGVHMDDGAFVVDARTVSELGNGSSNAGIELLERLGGHAVRGPGDGVSDSVPAKIGGTQEARVARDEVIFPAKDVKKLGGAKKLYALMDKAHKARKKAERGQDTGLRRGLA